MFKGIIKLKSLNCKIYKISVRVPGGGLTLKALGFLLPVQHWGGVFSTPSVKLDPDILES